MLQGEEALCRDCGLDDNFSCAGLAELCRLIECCDPCLDSRAHPPCVAATWLLELRPESSTEDSSEEESAKSFATSDNFCLIRLLFNFSLLREHVKTLNTEKEKKKKYRV